MAEPVRLGRFLRSRRPWQGLVLCLAGCVGASSSEGPDGATAGVSSRAPDAALGSPDASDVALRCRAPSDALAAPRTIAETVELINALPRPVSLGCFVESLARPLALQAVDSTFSAQPAQGPRSPRVFIFFDGLILSVVLDGPSDTLLEFGEARPEQRSLKAELEFPVDGPLDAASPYERLPYTDHVTSCGLCHQGEERDLDVPSPHALISPALRPMPEQRVPLADLAAEASGCDPESEPLRCRLLDALFWGDRAPVEHDFPQSYPTFF